MKKRAKKRLSVRFGCVFASGILLSALHSDAFAAFQFNNERWDSASQLLQLARQDLGSERVVVRADLDWKQLSERDALLVLHPESRLDFTEATAFLSAGGRIAVVDDYGKADGLLKRFHIDRIQAPRNPKEVLRGNRALQVALPFVSFDESGAELRHPITQGVERVVTNHPTALRMQAGIELTRILTIQNDAGENSLFAVVGVIGDALRCGLNGERPETPGARCGRLFAMGDASVFINLMMQFEGNRKLARGLLSYLLEDDTWGKRQGNLYIVVNRFSQTGHFGDRTDLGRQLESAMDTLDNWLNDTRTDGLPGKLALLLAALLALAASLWAWRFSGKPYTRPEPRYTRPALLLSQGGAAGRVAVLAAPTTHNALVVLELKTAAEEWLRDRLGLPIHASDAAILAELKRTSTLNPKSCLLLEKLFADMNRAEKAVMSSESIRISQESVKDMHHLLVEILKQVKDYVGSAR